MTDLHDEIRDANTYADQRAREYRAEQREIAARLNNDMQALLAAAEEMFLAWAKDGLLDRTHRQTVFDHSVHRWVSEELPPRSPLEASSYYAACIRDTLHDALSGAALEAFDVADKGGRQ